MTIQISFLVYDPEGWSNLTETWTAWKDLAQGTSTEYVPDGAVHYRIREKPAFKPGWWVLRTAPTEAQVRFLSAPPLTPVTGPRWRPLREWTDELLENEAADG